MIERIIAYHCGPALAGIKPANMVACHKNKIPNIHQEIARLNQQLNGRDIYFEILCECQKRVVLLVYRSKLLEAYLHKQEIQDLLSTFGYERNGELAGYLETLKKRMRLTGKEFPHEIGAFLGYPSHDIYGFIHHKDTGCLMVGEWKVYQNAEYARALFLRYHICRRAILKRLMDGKTLAQVFRAS